MTNDIQIHRDTITEKLDEMADISEYWKRQRDKGRNPNAIRSAMLMLAQELTMVVHQQEAETAEKLDRMRGPTAYHEANSR